MREYYNGVVDGLDVTGYPAARSVAFAAGRVVIAGNIMDIDAFVHHFGASVDTYMDVSPDGELLYQEVAVGAPAPVLRNDHIRLYRIRTNNATAAEADLRHTVPTITYATTPPNAGNHLQGDLVWNSDPDPDDPVGWVCTVSGAPGTWVAFGYAMNKLGADQIADGAIGTDHLANDAVTSAKIANGAVTPQKTSGVPILYRLGKPLLAVGNAIVASTNMQNGAYTLTSDPDPYTMDVPRNVTLKRSTAGNADTPGAITVEGTDINGAPVSEVIIPGANNVTVAGKVAFATVTSVTGEDWVIDEGNDTIIVGFGDELGLPVKPANASDVMLAVFNLSFAAVDADIGATVSACTIDLSSGTYDGVREALVFIR